MSTATIDVAAFLEERRDTILSSAQASVVRTRLSDYEAAGPDTIAERLQNLFDRLVACARDRHLDAVRAYAAELGSARQRAGYQLAQVQTVINVLEETVWRAVTADVPPEDLAFALGIVSTILGAAKDQLACSYLSASTHDVRSIRLDELFGGTENLGRV